MMIIGVIFLVLGIVVSFLPHDFHNLVLSGGYDIHEHGSHDMHIGFGFIIAFIGLILIIVGWRIL